nr:flagellar assembly peptidoglycan hydrolase FlgJ [Serpens gallinarum]
MKFSAPSVGDSGAYTDLNRLNQLKVGKDRDSEENTRKVAQEFESLFLSQMFKAMRQANDVLADDNFMNSETSKHYRDMHDQQMAVTLPKQGAGIGLADVLVRQLSKDRQASVRENPFRSADAPALAGAAVERPTLAGGSDGELRDDRQLLKARRLSLPSYRSGGATQAAPETAALATAQPGQPLVDLDWKPAQAYAAPERGGLLVNGRPVSDSAPMPTRFNSPEEFVAAMLPMAEGAARRLGVDARHLVAQAALETGWGRSIIRQDDGSSSHNLFGIKAHGWGGDSASTTTTEFYNGQAVKEQAEFRSYASYAQSFDDYATFLQSNGRYQEALQTADNPDKFMRELQQAGYATDPQYARKVNQIAKQLQTYQMVAAAGTTKNI